MVLHVAFVQSEGKFIDVAAKVLLADVVVHADQPALENCKDALNRVGRYVVTGKLASRMVDGFVSEKQAAKPAVGQSFVSV